jgi:hypothetical protein
MILCIYVDSLNYEYASYSKIKCLKVTTCMPIERETRPYAKNKALVTISLDTNSSDMIIYNLFEIGKVILHKDK